MTRYRIINGQDPSAYSQRHINLLIKHNVIGSVVNVGIYNPWTVASETLGETARIAAQWMRTARYHRPNLSIATKAEDLELDTGSADCKTNIILAFQGLDAIDFSVDNVDLFHTLGVRIMQLTYNEPNRLGDGCAELRDGGITAAGRTFIARMDELGIVLDLSHAGRQTSLEAIEAASHAPIFSHSNARRLADTPRNVDDVQMRAVAERGGVIGISMFPPLLVTGGKARLDDFVRHVEYVTDLVGAAHVGLGLDFPSNASPDHWSRLAAALEVPSEGIDAASSAITGVDQLPAVLDKLADLGFSENELAGIAGGNFLRVFTEVWK